MRLPAADQAALRAIEDAQRNAGDILEHLGAAVEPESRAFMHRILTKGIALESLKEHAPACGARPSDAARALYRLVTP